MATPLTDSINALTTYANEVTGASDTTLSDAVHTLVDGYGQGGGYIGLEYIYDVGGNTVPNKLIWHGGGIIPRNGCNSLFNSVNKNIPITFPDNPVGIGDSAFFNARLKIDWDSIGKELLSCANNCFRINYYEDCSAQIVRFPKLTGETINGMSSQGTFLYTPPKAPGTYYFDTMRNIPREFFANISHTNFSITFGSVGHGVQSTGLYPFHNSTAAAVGTITVYTTGEYLDAVKTSLEYVKGSGNLTFVYKASEATTYNGTSYSAGDTIVTSTP